MSMDFAGFKAGSDRISSTYFPVDNEINLANSNARHVIDILGLGDFEHFFECKVSELEEVLNTYVKQECFLLPRTETEQYMERVVVRLVGFIKEIKEQGCDMVQLG